MILNDACINTPNNESKMMSFPTNVACVFSSLPGK